MAKKTAKNIRGAGRHKKNCRCDKCIAKKAAKKLEVKKPPVKIEPPKPQKPVIMEENPIQHIEPTPEPTQEPIEDLNTVIEPEIIPEPEPEVTTGEINEPEQEQTGEDKFNEFAESVKPEEEPEPEPINEPEEEPETDEEGYEEVKQPEEVAATQTPSAAAKKSFSEIAASKSMGFNATMLIAACDWLFPKLIKFYYTQFKKDKRIEKVKFSDIKLTDEQIESLGQSTEAMAEFIFQYINPAWFFFIGLAMHYDSNIQKALDKIPKEETK